MARLAYIVTLAFVGVLLVMLDAPELASPVHIDASSSVPTPLATPLATPLPSSTGAPTEPTPQPTPAGRDIAEARIVIARLGIDLPLAWGDVARDVPRSDFQGATPENVALVFPGSALPGGGGNTYIYAHARTGMFITLWNVRIGDEVVLRWPDAELRYEVQQIIPRVDPNDTSWLDPRGPERLTLQTSTGPVAANPRFVAVATPVPAQ